MTIRNRLATGLGMLCITVHLGVVAAPHPSMYFPGQMLVKYKTTTPDKAYRVPRPFPDARLKAAMPRLGWELIELPPGVDVRAAVDAYRSLPDIAHAEPNYRIRLFATPNDARWAQQWNLKQINAVQAWSTTTGSTTIVVAFLDTGLDYNHPDLAANVWNNPGEIPGNSRDDDLNGYVDDVHGINLLNNGGDVRDDDGHGTHVAGIIGAVGNNGLGLAGINWQARLLPIKIFSADDSAGTAAAAEGYDYLIALKQRGVNVRVVNNSWGGPVPSQALADAIRAAEAAGILTVCAAGNDHLNADDQPEFPATLDCESLISVAASTRDDDPASFSNYGSLTVDLAAPGEAILSTYRGAAHYQQLSGTSMASPHVAGAAALLFAQNTSLTPATVKALLMATADPLAQWQGRVVSGGRLNAGRAIERLVSGPIPTLPPETNELALPFPRITSVSRNAQGRLGNAASYFPSLSTNGQFIAFLSLATNLLSGTSGTNAQVYFQDRSSRAITLISRSGAGAVANADCADVRISGDGSCVAFSSSASNLLPNDHNNASDIFLFDRTNGQIELISKNSGSFAGNGASEYAGISDNGRYVVFASDASDLVSSDLNGYRDIFVRDRQTATTIRASVSSSFAPANYTSDLPNISGDGRYITFLSGADNLVVSAWYPAYQLYLRDRVGNKTTLISKSPSGAPGRGSSGSSSLSADGRYIAFDSSATNLVTGDRNLMQDIFLYDRVGLTMKRISVGNNGAQSDDDSWWPFVTAKGRHVYFMSFGSTLNAQDDDYACDIFDYDRLTGKLSRLIYNHAGRTGADDSYAPCASADGRYVAFDSRAWNLVPGGANGNRDVMIMDRGAAIPDLMIYASGETNWHGLGLHGTNIVQRRQLPLTNSLASFSIRLVNNGPATEQFSIRANTAPAGWTGQFFRGTTNLTSLITGGGWTASLAPASNVVLRLDVTSVTAAEGESCAEWFIVASATTANGARDAVRAVVTRTPSPPSLQVVSRAADGRPGNNASGSASLSADGRFVAFTATASDLTQKDYNLQEDVFVMDRQTMGIECLSQLPGSETGNGRSFDPQISRDGRYVVFQSDATNLVSGDVNDRRDIFLADRQTHELSRISVTAGGVQAYRDSAAPSMSGDGRYIAFESLADNFAAADYNQTYDIFLRDRNTGTLECLSLAGATTANDESHSPVISNDGSIVLFSSLAGNLATGDTNEAYDVFLWQRGVPGVTLISRTADGIPGNDRSSHPSISDDNRYVVFSSYATNLAVQGLTTNSITFLFDRQTAQLSQLDPSRIAPRQRHSFYGAHVTPDGQSILLLADVSPSAGSGNFVQGIFLYNRAMGTVTELSRMRNGTPGNDASDGATMSANSRYVALSSRAANLIGETVAPVDQMMLCDLASFQPDGLIRRDTAPYRGQDLFVPSVQWVEQTVKLNFTNVFYVKILNHASFTDSFIFKGPPKITGGIKARYFLQPAGTEITTQVTNAGWKSELLAAGASRELKIQIIASNTNLFNQDLVFTSTSVTDTTKVDVVRVRLFRDDDNDGLPNTWEQKYFAHLTSVLPGADGDGDGRSNLAEYIAGTNPNDAASNLRAFIEMGVGPSALITWPAVTNRFYTIERAIQEPLNFTTAWQMIGNSPQASCVDLAPRENPSCFYRIRVEVP